MTGIRLLLALAAAALLAACGGAPGNEAGAPANRAAPPAANRAFQQAYYEALVAQGLSQCIDPEIVRERMRLEGRLADLKVALRAAGFARDMEAGEAEYLRYVASAMLVACGMSRAQNIEIARHWNHALDRLAIWLNRRVPGGPVALVRLSGDGMAAAVVRDAYRTAAEGDGDGFASLTATGAVFVEAVGPGRPLRLEDLRLEPGCVLHTIDAPSTTTAIASGGCSAPNLPRHSWPYESRFELRDNRIVSVRRVPFEW